MGDNLQLNSSGMQCIGAYHARAQGKARGGIVVVQEIFGVNAHIRRLVDGFAAQGYEAIAPAFFDHLETGVELDYDAAGIARGSRPVDELDVDRVLADVGSAADAISLPGASAWSVIAGAAASPC